MATKDFDRLLIGNSDFLKPFAVTLTKDRDKADDLYQETLYKALANHDKYQKGTNIQAWLYTIMRNIFINDYRKMSKQKKVMDISGDGYIANNSMLSVPNTAESNLRMKEIDQAIFELPAIFKNAFQLYFQGYKYHEIADLLCEPLGTIKSRIHFARKLLKEKLDRR